MVKAVLFVTFAILRLSSAQVDSAPKRARIDDSVTSSSMAEEQYFGRTNFLRRGANIQRSLQLSMSMSIPELSEFELSMSMPVVVESELDLSMSIPAAVESVDESTIVAGPHVPIGCMSDEDCSAGSSCKCWLNCKFCIAEFAPCGICEAIGNDGPI
ncbi:hypothetical protein ACHAWU_008583 [Discostella pseudostelligera]|uniref:Uncharacterized protein n=1 Tax=Discostella pseudostelligera TaxID=259834 RepID=A0ABD3M8Q6_9STRA